MEFYYNEINTMNYRKDTSDKCKHKCVIEY